MSYVTRVNLLIIGAGLALCLLGIWQSATNRVLQRGMRRFFITFFAFAAFCVLGNLASEITDGDPEWRFLTKFGMFEQSFSSSVLMLLLSGLLLYLSGEKRYWRHPLFITAFVLWLLYIGLLIYTQFSTVIYYYDEQNFYRRGSQYPLLLVSPILTMGVNLLLLRLKWGALTPRSRHAFLVYLLTPLAAMLIQMWFYGVMTVVFGTTLAAFYMFANMLNEQLDRFYRQEQENTQLKTEIMLTQIQPHFLYNTLGAIQSLCRTDPKAADKAIAKFSRYLRGNMDSLTQRGAIPFERELQHTRLYLELEQLRYEDALTVEYNLETTDFSLPTLTLQPLAENAVRHGVRRNADGRGTVTVQTRAYPDRIEVSVTDDGPGFDPLALPDDGHSHIGLMNVRQRLQTANGRLAIESSDSGTRAVIVLPKEG